MPISLTCDRCGKPFVRKPSQVSKYPRHFCSAVCARQADSRPLEARFWEHVDRDGRGPDDCWLWTGKRMKSGYGVIWLDSYRTATTHRVSWELHNGPMPIPDGFVVCHRCDNPACVNPTHLFLGSQADNIHDMRQKGRGSNPPRLAGDASPMRRPEVAAKFAGELNHSAKLTEGLVCELRIRFREGTSIRALARETGLARPTLSAMIRRKTWAHVN